MENQQAPTTMWDVFKMDRRREIDGVTFEYPGGIRVTLARAGGGNTQFARSHEIHMRPVRAALGLKEALPEAKQRRLIANIYADSVIRKFETNVSPDPTVEDWQPVVLWSDGSVKPVDRDLLVELLILLPDLMDEIVKDSTNLANFRKEQLQADAGN
ncbi:hypothetical protein [Staphylococcus aureus]|uniref:hypothetical protein n=1 Tax=Staphylococcus aureus TaxID=1280 RepID=UPI00129F7A7A|nr:hypothetical protein [Staphylococcus aureus]AYD82591.1 putative structural protein [Achromobacter phage vB_Ade_ART]MBD4209908.1 hypothetical protein [Xanthomonas citri pv. citri]